MMGPWIDSPLFMGLLEDNYIYEIKERKEKKNDDTESMSNLQSKIRNYKVAKE
jgi:hypothetical protein